jgi:hypothetical protein
MWKFDEAIVMNVNSVKWGYYKYVDIKFSAYDAFLE